LIDTVHYRRIDVDPKRRRQDVSPHRGSEGDASGVPPRIDPVLDDSPVAVVSGGDQGLGPEVVRRLSALGMRVVLGCRSVERGRLLIDDLGELADHVAVRPLDVTDAGSVDGLASWVAGRLGRCDVLVSNLVLGFSEDPEAPGSTENARTEFLTNLRGTRRLAHAVAPMMRAIGHGRVVVMVAGDPAAAAMAQTTEWMANCEVNSLITDLAKELVGGGILANAYCCQLGAPGAAVETPVWLATLSDDGPTGHLYS